VAVAGPRLFSTQWSSRLPGSRGALGQIAKLAYLRAMGADGWDLSGVNPNRRRYLAQLARRSTNQALQRRSERVRLPRSSRSAPIRRRR